jgi:hypothetical protein
MLDELSVLGEAFESMAEFIHNLGAFIVANKVFMILVE